MSKQRGERSYSVWAASLATCLLAVASCVVGTAQEPTAAAAGSYAIPVSGTVKTPVTLTPEVMHKLPRHTLDAKNEHDPTAHSYSGVYLTDVLQMAGVPSGHDLRGAALKTYILVEARDNYAVVFSIAETDAGFTNKIELVADEIDGKPFAAEQGPLKLIVPDEKRPARWIRQISAIKVGLPDGK